MCIIWTRWGAAEFWKADKYQGEDAVRDRTEWSPHNCFAGEFLYLFLSFPDSCPEISRLPNTPAPNQSRSAFSSRQISPSGVQLIKLIAVAFLHLCEAISFILKHVLLLHHAQFTFVTFISSLHLYFWIFLQRRKKGCFSLSFLLFEFHVPLMPDLCHIVELLK